MTNTLAAGLSGPDVAMFSSDLANVCKCSSLRNIWHNNSLWFIEDNNSLRAVIPRDCTAARSTQPSVLSGVGESSTDLPGWGEGGTRSPVLCSHMAGDTP